MSALLPEELTPLLRTRILGRQCIFAEEMTSTNAVLKERASSLPEGALVCCESQSAGRGRSDHSWHSPRGVNLYFSVLLLPPRRDAVRLPQLAMLAALALHRALRREIPGLTVMLKWPNDLWCGSRKLSGILCEVAAGGHPGGGIPVVLGVGINVNSSLGDFPPDLRESAGSLSTCTGGRLYDRPRILAAFLNHLEQCYLQWLESADFSPFAAEWSRHDLLAGRTITVEGPCGCVTGLAMGLAPKGTLLLKRDGAAVPEEIFAGDIHIRREGFLSGPPPSSSD